MIRKNNKKGTFYAEAMVQLFTYIILALILIIFYVLFNVSEAKSRNNQILSSHENLDANAILLDFVRTEVELDEQTITIGDIVSMVDIDIGKYERINLFQNTAKEIFPEQFPFDIGKDKGAHPWWLRVYDETEEPKKPTAGGNKYFKVFPVPGEGYIYGPGANCDPSNTKDFSTAQINVPKVDKGYAKVVFCIMKKR